MFQFIASANVTIFMHIHYKDRNAQENHNIRGFLH